MNRMNRSAVVFGDQDHLVGVLGVPGVDRDPGQGERLRSTGVVMLTAGMLPSCGPYRLHQRLAERLASVGMPSLSFDLSGIGESLGVGSAGTSLDRAASEASAAIDVLLAQAGCERVILFGLCSGADDAIAAAGKDDRVAGVILLDGFGYRTRRFYWHRLVHHYLYRALQTSTWKGRWDRWRSGKGSVSTMPSGLDIREFPPLDQMRVALQGLIDREMRFHFIYTGGVADYYNHAGQVWEMMPGVQWNERATTRFFAEMDHTATLCEDRERLIEEIVDSARGFADSAGVIAGSGIVARFSEPIA